eukprot:10360120-Alexandrium_andersonii.AAC.1
MVLSPFRSAGVVVRWPYLGISAGTRALEAAGVGRGWGAAEYRRMVAATWAKAIEKVQARSAAPGAG